MRIAQCIELAKEGIHIRRQRRMIVVELDVRLRARRTVTGLLTTSCLVLFFIQLRQALGTLGIRQLQHAGRSEWQRLQLTLAHHVVVVPIEDAPLDHRLDTLAMLVCLYRCCLGCAFKLKILFQ